MRFLFISAATVGAAAFGVAGPAVAQDKCFDKGTLSYIDCPQPAPAPAPAPAPVVYTPPPAWTGWYLGAHAGYAWADVDSEFGIIGDDDLEVDGFLAGGQLGYQHQYASNWVIGVEIDGSAVFADDSENDSFTVVGGSNTITTTDTIEAELDWLASARLRLGYASDAWLPYITGGVAMAGYEATGSRTVVDVDNGVIPATTTTTSASQTSEETVFGGVVGAGVEYMVDPNWVLGAEGLYYFFDEEVDFSGVGGAGSEVEFGNVAVGRVRLSYKF